MRQLIRRVLETCGVDVRLRRNVERARQAEKHRASRQKWACLARYRPRMVLDIGANTGQFAQLVREFCPTAAIVSFEPLRDCFESLQSRLKSDPLVTALPYALGSRNGTADIHRSTFSPSSSLLPMGALHRQEFPYTAQTTTETIEIRRLDDVAREIELQAPLIAKIDVQGYECEVLDGGRETLRRCAALVVELSNYAMYENQPLFDEAYRTLTDLGFVYRGNLEQLLSPLDGRILQFDGLFENRALVHEPATNGAAAAAGSAP